MRSLRPRFLIKPLTRSDPTWNYRKLVKSNYQDTDLPDPLEEQYHYPGLLQIETIVFRLDPSY